MPRCLWDGREQGLSRPWWNCHMAALSSGSRDREGLEGGKANFALHREIADFMMALYTHDCVDR